MTPGVIRATVVAERVAWVRKMVDGIRNLSFSTYDEFISDPRNGAAAESYLRRALEALLDLGRHILAKGFALAPTEYKEIAQLLVENGIEKAEHGSRASGCRIGFVSSFFKTLTHENHSL